MNYLLCSLYTLVSEDILFKGLNLKYDTPDKVNHRFYFSTKSTLLPFFKLINKESIRSFAYILIRPFLSSPDYNVITSSPSYEELITQTSQLKKYMRKYRYNYIRYFLNESEDENHKLTRKEINVIAIEALFLLTSI